MSVCHVGSEDADINRVESWCQIGHGKGVRAAPGGEGNGASFPPLSIHPEFDAAGAPGSRGDAGKNGERLVLPREGRRVRSFDPQVTGRHSLQWHHVDRRAIGGGLACLLQRGAHVLRTVAQEHYPARTSKWQRTRQRQSGRNVRVLGPLIRQRNILPGSTHVDRLTRRRRKDRRCPKRDHRGPVCRIGGGQRLVDPGMSLAGGGAGEAARTVHHEDRAGRSTAARKKRFGERHHEQQDHQRTEPERCPRHSPPPAEASPEQQEERQGTEQPEDRGPGKGESNIGHE